MRGFCKFLSMNFPPIDCPWRSYTECSHTVKQTVQNKDTRYEYIKVSQRTMPRKSPVFEKNEKKKKIHDFTYSLAVSNKLQFNRSKVKYILQYSQMEYFIILRKLPIASSCWIVNGTERKVFILFSDTRLTVRLFLNRSPFSRLSGTVYIFFKGFSFKFSSWSSF